MAHLFVAPHAPSMVQIRQIVADLTRLETAHAAAKYPVPIRDKRPIAKGFSDALKSR
jgi:hypothetical protein